MKIQEFVNEDSVHLELEANDLVQALEAVSVCIAPSIGMEPRAVVEALLERERLGSTSVGDGFAIPHCKLPGLKNIEVALGRFTEAVEFGAADEDPVVFFFVVLSPPDQPALHLQVLSQIARVLKRSELRSELTTAATPEEVVMALRDAAAAEGL
jgi:mannitol/fructose-specific phosphotransferase system IIA component (Ntr-type)